MFRSMPWKAAAVLVSAASALTAALTVGVSPAQASGGDGTSQLNPGQTLSEGQELVRGSLSLRMQYDGNLVLYTGSHACWATHTRDDGHGQTHAYMEPQGDFAVFQYSHSGQLWHTNTYGAGELVLVLDGGRKGPVLRY